MNKKVLSPANYVQERLQKSRNSSRKVSTMIAVFLRPLDKSTMLLRATHWIDSAMQDFLEASRLHSLERHGTRALVNVTVGRGHVTRGT